MCSFCFLFLTLLYFSFLSANKEKKNYHPYFFAIIAQRVRDVVRVIRRLPEHGNCVRPGAVGAVPRLAEYGCCRLFRNGLCSHLLFLHSSVGYSICERIFKATASQIFCFRIDSLNLLLNLLQTYHGLSFWFWGFASPDK